METFQKNGPYNFATVLYNIITHNIIRMNVMNNYVAVDLAFAFSDAIKSEDGDPRDIS